MLVDVVEGQALLDHHDLQVINLLADFLGQPLVTFVLGGHPDLRSFLHNLLADGMHSAVKLLDGSRPYRAGLCLGGQLGEEFLECLVHSGQATDRGGMTKPGTT